MSKNQVNKATPQGVATSEIPEFLRNLGGVGNENVSRADMVVPRLVLLQALSPQLKRSDEANYIEGAEPGMLVNTVTQDKYTSLKVVNCFFEHEFAVFKKRTAGGGFRGTFPTLQAAQNHVNISPDASDLEVSEQAVHYVLIVGEDGSYQGEAALVLASTKMKVSRKWNSLISLAGGNSSPRFSRLWKLGSVEERNAMGDFYNLTVSPAGFITEALAAPAMALYEAVKAGTKAVERTAKDGGAETEY